MKKQVLDFELKLLLLKVGKYCYCCAACKKASEKCDYQQPMLDIVAEAYDFAGDSVQYQKFFGRLVDACSGCIGDGNLVYQLVVDYLKKFEAERVVKTGNLFRIGNKAKQ